MKRTPENKAPADAEARKDVSPVICYPVDTLPAPAVTAALNIPAMQPPVSR